MKYLPVVALVVAGLGLATRTRAMEPMPLPLFEVTALDGVSVRSDRLPLQGKWLLIYVQRHCRPCESVLRLLKKEQVPSGIRRIVVVVGEVAAEDVKRMAEKFPDLVEAGWYADPEKQAFVQLGLQGVPVVLGARGETIEWSLGGLPAPPTDLQSIVTSWLAE